MGQQLRRHFRPRLRCRVEEVIVVRRHAWNGLLLLVVVSLGACEDPVDFDDPFGNLLFPGRTPIEIATPGEQCTVPPTPQFVWHATGKRLVHAAVFAENIDVRDGRIANPAANVWAWHSGLGTGAEGLVRYEDGVDVRDGVLQEGAEPTPLQQGSSYVWAVWAWNESGTQVTHSSAPIFFTVDSTGVGCPTFSG